MYRLVLLLLFTAAAVAAPVPKAVKKTGGTLMPLGLGHKWEYSSPEAPDAVNETREITAVEEKGGVVTATQKTTNLTQVFRADAAGTAVISTDAREYKNPRVILKPEMKEGDSWEWDAGGYTEVRTVGKAEKVTVPAGEYTAVPISVKYVQQGQEFQSTTVWYADGVGLVRIDRDGQPTQVLKAFTAGGKK